MTDRTVEEAEGYFLLEMYEDALAALDELERPDAERDSVLILRINIHSQMKQFADGARIARTGLLRYPDNADFHILGAWCVRRAENMEEAYLILSSAQKLCTRLPALWYYNMACYECQMGNLDAVAGYYERAVAMDETFEKLGKIDDDLAPWFASR